MSDIAGINSGNPGGEKMSTISYRPAPVLPSERKIINVDGVDVGTVWQEGTRFQAQLSTGNTTREFFTMNGTGDTVEEAVAQACNNGLSIAGKMADMAHSVRAEIL